MAQYFTDFSEYATNQVPSDWTRRFVVTSGVWMVRDAVDATGGKVLEFPAVAASARRGITWNAIDGDSGRGNCEVAFRFRGDPPFATSQVAGMSAIARASGSAGTETGYTFDERGESALGRRIGRYIGGAFAELSNTPGALTNDEWYWVRGRANGTNLQIKMWHDSVSEPNDWTASVSDSSISAAGWVGLFAAGMLADIQIDAVGVGTDGDEAPLEAIVIPENITPPTLTGIEIAGQILLANLGTWVPPLVEGEYTITWQKRIDEVPPETIVGEDSVELLLGVGLVLHQVRVGVTPDGGEVVWSEWSGVIPPTGNQINFRSIDLAPRISGHVILSPRISGAAATQTRITGEARIG